ncbi:MAG: M24 family metallopeptidase [Methanosarcinaceae archaeon]|nr:M24 family metallopeptidase [Methanosarcinaceae archaeon]
MRIPISVFVERVNLVKVRVAKMNLNALVVYSSGSSLGFASRTHGYLQYLCNWDSMNQAAVMILTPEKDPILLVSGRSAKLFAAEIMWFNDIRSVQQNEFGKEIINALRPILKKGNRLGYIGRAETPSPLYDTLRGEFKDTELVQENKIIDDLRVVKDSMAIHFHRRAANICDTMVDTFRREVRSGKKVYQIQADLEHIAKFEGCEYASTFLSVGPVVDRPRYAKRECSQIPKEGDQVLLALFVLRDGHWGHEIRTGSIGKAKRLLRETFKIVLEMQDAMLKKIYPGSPICEIWQASETVLNKYYPDARDQDWYWLKIGHGLGLDYSDPILSDLFPDPFNMSKKSNLQHPQHEKYACIMPGMLIEIHPNIFIPNYAAAALGDMVLTTDTGYEILNKCPRELLVF